MSTNINLKNSTDTTFSITHSDGANTKVLDSKDIAVAVDTVADFPANPNDGDVVIVRDLNRGGTFIYDSSEVAGSNDGTNFDGWIRQYSGAVNVKWFGAKGDGVTDDTTAIQNAINNSNKVMLSGEHVISSTIIMASEILNPKALIGDKVSGLVGRAGVAFDLLHMGKECTIEGINLTIDRFTSGTCSALTITPSIYSYDIYAKTIINNLQIIGFRSGDYPVDGTGISMVATANSVEAFNFISMVVADNVYIRNTRNGIVMKFDGTPDGTPVVFINSNTFDNLVIVSCLNPLVLDGSAHYTQSMVQNTFRGQIQYPAAIGFSTNYAITCNNASMNTFDMLYSDWPEKYWYKFTNKSNNNIVNSGTLVNGGSFNSINHIGANPVKIINEQVNIIVGAELAGFHSFTTLTDALNFASRYVTTYRNTAANLFIVLADNYVMSEQVIVNGLDLSYIRIYPQLGQTVTINRSSLSMLVEGRYPAFAALNGGKLPRISTLFTMNATGDATNRDGIFCKNGSSVVIDANCGVTNAGGAGLKVDKASSASALGSNFSSALAECVTSNGASRVDCTGANITGAGTYGAFSFQGSVINCLTADASGAFFHGFAVTAGGVITAGSSTGTLTQTANIITSSGIIYK